MLLEELAAYAEEKYNITLRDIWNSDPGSFYTLNDPATGGMIAYLSRKPAPGTGAERERCDLRCGEGVLAEFSGPYLSQPFRMYGKKWVGIAFDERTEPDVVYALFDRAVAACGQYGCTLVLDPLPASVRSALADNASDAGGQYTEIRLPFAGAAGDKVKDNTPERIRQMRRLYEYGVETPEEKARNFCRQGKYMEDYEDDAPPQPFFSYFPTYHDMNMKQLRGYFAWRTQIRKGERPPISGSAAYVYVYELLNGIGAASPEESIRKLKEFESWFPDFSRQSHNTVSAHPSCLH